jgi:DNA-binding MarR family transcriptional regulator
MSPEQADRMAKLIALVCNVVDRALMHEARAAGKIPLSATQFAGLRFVALHPGTCVRDLAQGLHVSHSAAVKLTERLRARGLLERSECPDDRRRVCLRLTPTGQELWEQVRRAHAALVGQVLDEMGAEAARRLEEFATSFVKTAVRSVDRIGRVCLYCGVEHQAGCPLSQAEEVLTGQPRQNY